MKYKLLLLIFVLFSTTLFAQRYGVRAGINISNLDFEPAPVSRNLHRNGFYFGGFAEFPLSETVHFNAELQWSAEGAKDDDWQADYINVPVQLRFSLSDRISIGAGPQISIKTWKNQDNFDTFSYGAVGGLEYSFLNDFFIDVRASYRLSNMFNEDIVPAGLEASQFLIQVGVGIKM